MSEIKNIDIDYASLYGVLPGERDFSGAMKRVSKCKDSKEYQRKTKELIDFIKNIKSDRGKEYLKKEEKLHKEVNQLIYEYNRRLQNDNYKNKDEVRRWFYSQIPYYVEKGIPEFTFYYCECMFPIKELKEIYGIN